MKIETTDDGSLTLYREDIDEHYHSVKGALTESEHVYINLGWRKFAETNHSVNVFEVGFGTGLNAALTAQAALSSGIPTTYHAVELYPLPADITDKLSVTVSSEYSNGYKSVNKAKWDESTPINEHFILHKIKGDILSLQLPEGIDVVYFDAFAPDKQPEMWEESLFRKFYESMTPGGILTTYCAKGCIRRLLKSVGFNVERLPGPPGGKREILRATRIE